MRRLASFVSEDEIIQLTDDIAGKVALRSLWQTKRGASDLTAGQMPHYHAQVSDFIRTLTVAIDTEAALKKHGVLATFGPVGILMEGHCQVGENGASTILRCRFRVVFQQTPVTSFHTRKERVLNTR